MGGIVSVEGFEDAKRVIKRRRSSRSEIEGALAGELIGVVKTKPRNDSVLFLVLLLLLLLMGCQREP